jgi:hypothetical protein
MPLPCPEREEKGEGKENGRDEALTTTTDDDELVLAKELSLKEKCQLIYVDLK